MKENGVLTHYYDETTMKTSTMTRLLPCALLVLVLVLLAQRLPSATGFVGTCLPPTSRRANLATPTELSALRRARDLVRSLVEEDQCYSNDRAAASFVDACAANVVIADRFFPQPFTAKSGARDYIQTRVAQRQAGSRVRIDKISDGDAACGFAWTWEDGSGQEGLRGTTFVELNERGEIAYLQEIPEAISKPGKLTAELLKAITQGETAPAPQPYEKKTPTVAHELAKYLFADVQKAGRTEESVDELMRFLDDEVIYRDFNFANVFRGPAQVRQFLLDFSFPGIEFRPLRFDDGVDSTCFTWEVVLEGAPDSIQCLSFFELDPTSRKITYVRDLPESAIKPPVLGTWARQLRPGLGVFTGVPQGSRPGGM